MASEALSPLVARQPARRQQQLEEYRDRLFRRAQESGGSITPATVFFKNGLTPVQLQQTMAEHQLEVIDAHLKAPQGNNGVIMSIMLGMSDLLASDGDLSSRLSFVLDAHQKCFAKSAKLLPEEDAQEWTDLASVQFKVYSARIFGSATALEQLQHDSNVSIVVLNLPQRLIDDFRNHDSRPGKILYTVPGFLC